MSYCLVTFQRELGMDQGSHCSAEREPLEAAGRISTFSTTSPSDEEQNQPKAEIACQVGKENPEKEDLRGWCYHFVIHVAISAIDLFYQKLCFSYCRSSPDLHCYAPLKISLD